MTIQETTCPYCEQTFQFNRYTWQSELSDHKLKCPKKRFLGGQLTIEYAGPEGDLS